MDWKLVVELYKHNAGMCTDTTGLSLVPKTKYEHIHLTSQFFQDEGGLGRTSKCVFNCQLLIPSSM